MISAVYSGHESTSQTNKDILFQVLECSWHELLIKVKEAEDLDNVIAAHETFLDTIINRCLLDEQSTVGCTEFWFRFLLFYPNTVKWNIFASPNFRDLASKT